MNNQDAPKGILIFYLVDDGWRFGLFARRQVPAPICKAPPGFILSDYNSESKDFALQENST
jgi:hypothetical protein